MRMDKKKVQKNIQIIHEKCHRKIRYYAEMYRNKYGISLDDKGVLINEAYRRICEGLRYGGYRMELGCAPIAIICRNAVHDYWRKQTMPNPHPKESEQRRRDDRVPQTSNSYHTYGNEGVETGFSDENGNPIRKPSHAKNDNPYSIKELTQELRACIKFKWNAKIEKRWAMLMFLDDIEPRKIAQELGRSEAWVSNAKHEFIKAAADNCPELILYIEELDHDHI